MGYAQHDSHELICFLLDGIHEDLNRVKKKPILPSLKEFPSSVPDYEVAKKFWERYMKRNNSIIADLMGG